MKQFIYLFAIVLLSLTACKSGSKTGDATATSETTANKDADVQAEAKAVSDNAETPSKPVVLSADEQNKIDAELIKKYIADNNLDAKSTESGIHYVVEKEGDGTHPDINSFVQVHYKGTRLDGVQFDSSYDRGEPTTFPLKGVVKGWQEGIPLFSKGGKGTLLIPSSLAYGPRGAGGDIPPNTVLRFDIELLDVMSAEDKAKKEAEAAKEQNATDDKLIVEYAKKNNLTTKKTDSGIHYVVEKEGTGDNPTINSTVEVHYKGTLLDGTTFDSSYDRGQPATFPLARVVKGWQEGIPLFKKGGKGTLLIPSSLAYGSRGAGGKIPPNSVLRFDIELLDIK